MSLLRSILALIALTSQAPAALTDGLAAYYDFEADLSDKSGNARHLAIAGGTPEAGFAGDTVSRSGSSVDRSTLLAGKALNLVDADGDYVKAPLGSGAAATTAGIANLGGTFTISAWHYLAPLPSNTSPRYFVFEAATNFDISWGTTSGDSYQAFNAQTSGPSATLTRGAWHQVVHVFKTVDDLVIATIYVDGQQIGGFSAEAADLDFARIVLGNARDGQDRKWDGLIDEVAIWNRELLPAELGELRARGLAGIGVTDNLASRGKAYIHLAVSDPLLGSVTGSGLYNVAATAPVSVETIPGYRFDSWSGGFSGKPAAFDHMVAASLSSTAHLSIDLDDDDGDGLSNYDEVAFYGTNPALTDSDGDGIPDGDEVFITETHPMTSDAARVQRAATFFGAAHTGGIALASVQMDGGGATSASVLFTSLLGTAGAGAPWLPLSIAPQAAVIDVGGSLILRFPAPSPSTSTYQVLGHVP